jgi:tRNA1(Val) A37 N6-methylase TrmN6
MYNIVINEDEQVDDLLLDNLKIIQKKNAFRYGTDAVLLSDFAIIPKKARVLDIGTGTGIIPILLSYKYDPAHITGIDIQSDMVEMACRSVNMNDLGDLIDIKCIDVNDLLKEYPKRSFDVIVTNPPYKRAGSGILNDADNITVARHEIKCTLEDIIRVSSDLLTVGGIFYMICRPERLADTFEYMRKYKIEPKKLTMVHSDIKKQPVMFLVQGVFGGGKNLLVTEPVIIRK